MKSLVIIGLLVITLALGAIQAADSRFHSRQLMSEIYAVKSQTDKMRLEWSQLILEISTLTNEGIIYQFAEQQLNMNVPKAQTVIYRTH